MPQYGKYKAKAAHTEVKATFSNFHAAQALYMVDNNEYADGLDDLKIAVPSGTYVYGTAANVTTTNDSATFSLTQNDGTTADTSVFYIYASAKKKLAGCSSVTSAPFDAWCLDYTKLMSNDDGVRGACKTGTGAAETLVNGGC